MGVVHFTRCIQEIPVMDKKPTPDRADAPPPEYKVRMSDALVGILAL